jgi:RNA polymerase sigma-70 factor (ECF subfamily)
VLCCTPIGGDDTAVAREALEKLCQAYWRPIFAFICRRGYSVPDAQDLSLDFFLSVLEGALLRRADPNRGRFRTYLLHALQNFLNDMKDKRRTHKRGGDVQFISWDDWMAEAPSQLSIPEHALETWPAERLFDLRWAATVVEHALRALAEECESRGRRRVFDVLSGVLGAERADVSIADLAKRLGVTEGSAKQLLHQMRERYRRLLREEVAQTVEDPTVIDDELRYLCAVLTAGENK